MPLEIRNVSPSAANRKYLINLPSEIAITYLVMLYLKNIARNLAGSTGRGIALKTTRLRKGDLLANVFQLLISLLFSIFFMRSFFDNPISR